MSATYLLAENRFDGRYNKKKIHTWELNPAQKVKTLYNAFRNKAIKYIKTKNACTFFCIQLNRFCSGLRAVGWAEKNQEREQIKERGGGGMAKGKINKTTTLRQP